MIKAITLASLVAPLLAATVTEAATVKRIPGRSSLVLTGPIENGDAGRFTEALAIANARGARIERIFLNSHGGSVGSALELAIRVNQSGIDTVVGPTDTCASACVIVLAASARRAAFSTSRIGVHSAATSGINAEGQTVTVETVDTKAATLDLARLYAKIGVPPRIVGRMVATPTAGMAWLTQGDAIEWGITVLPVRGVTPNPDAIGEVLR